MVRKKCHACETQIKETANVVCETCYTHRTKEKKVVINPMLTFIVNYQHRSSSMQLKIAITSFYNEDEVEEAKRILIANEQDLSLDLQELSKDRQNSSSRSAKEANIDDVIQIIKLLDGSDIQEDAMPKFCTDDLTRLPPAAPEASGSLMTLFEIIARQEKSIQSMQQSIVDVMASVHKNSSSIDAMKSVSAPSYAGAVNWPNLQKRNTNDQGAGPSTSTAANRPNGPQGPQTQPPYGHQRQPPFGPPASDMNSQMAPPLGAKTTGPSGRRPTNKKKGAAGGSDILTAGPTKFQVQITNVNPNLNDDAIKDYISNKDATINIDSVKIDDTSSPEWDTKRFCITFGIEYFDIVMNEDFWPERIYFRQWFPDRRRPPKNN